MTSPFDDLSPIEFAELVHDYALGVCYRCSNMVPWSDEHREAHNAWHRAVESAGASAPTQTEEFAPLRDQLIQHLTAGPAHRDEEACVDYLMPLIEDWAGRYLSRATTAEATSFQAIGLKRDLEMMTVRYQREADRIADYERETREARQKADDLEMALRRVEERTRTDLAEARAEVERSRAAVQRANDLVDELRKQVNALITERIRQPAELAELLDCAPQTSWRQLLAYVRALVHGPAEGELRRLRRVEDALVELGAPGSSTGDDPAGPMIAWIREVAGKQRGEPPFGLREQLLDALQVEDTGQDVVELVRKQAIELAAQRGIQRGQVSPTQDAYARATAALDKRHAELLDAMGIVEPIGFYDALDLVRAWRAERDPFRRTNSAEVSPTVAGIIDAQHVALLRLAAQGRRAYADGFPDGRSLRHEAAAFEAAARLLEDPRLLAGLIPTSMQNWALDDEVSEIVAKATGIHVVLLDPTPETAADPVAGCPPGTATISTRDDGSFSPPADADEDAEELTDQQLSDLLLLVGVTPSAAQLASWTPEQREQAANWAGLVHLDASDNDVDVPERPAFLDEPAAVPCQSKFLYQPDGKPERLLWCGKTVPHDEDHYHFLSPGHGVRWTSANQAGLIHLGDSGADPESRRETGWRCDACSHPNTDDASTCEACEATRREPAAAEPCLSLFRYGPGLYACTKTGEHDRHSHPSPSGLGVIEWTSDEAEPAADPPEPCPSLYLYRDNDTSTLLTCTVTDRPGHAAHYSGQNDAVTGHEIAWGTSEAVPVPWPLDQEPPPGIDVLRDTSTPREEDEPTFTLRRHGGGWVWQEGVEPIQALHGHTWAEVTERCGELHVVRP